MRDTIKTDSEITVVLISYSVKNLFAKESDAAAGTILL